MWMLLVRENRLELQRQAFSLGPECTGETKAKLRVWRATRIDTCMSGCAIRLLTMAGRPENGVSQIGNGVGNGHLVPVLLMLSAVMIWAIVPLAIDLSAGSLNPFLFGGGWRLGGAIGCGLFLLFRYPKLLGTLWFMVSGSERIGEADTREVVRRHFSLRGLGGWSLVYSAFGKFDYTLFAIAAQSVAISIVAVVFEIWPIVMIILMGVFFRDDPRYRRTGAGLFSMLCLCFVGITFVTLSGSADLFSADWQFVGIALAVLAALAGGSKTAVLFKWGNVLGRRLYNPTITGETPDSLYTFGTLLGQFLAQLLCFILSVVIGFAMGEHITSKVLIYSILGGIASAGIADVFFRKANASSDNLGINALSYLTPIFAILWLLPFADWNLNLDSTGYLVIGIIAIVMANLLLNFEAEIRWGFKALVLALGTCGAIVYLRDGLFEFLGINGWNWAGSGFFESITLAATVFTLLVAFRVARLSSRTSEEDNRVFSVYRKLDLLARRGVINPEACDYILEIDRANNDASTAKEAYYKVRRLIAEVDAKSLDEAEVQLLSDAESNLDALVRSKQLDIHLGEVFALGIFATITVGLSLLTLPPQLGGWTRLLVDLFAMLISAVVIFLMFHIHDLQRERDERKLESLEERAEHRGYLVRFIDTERRLPDQLLSLVVGTAIVLAYAGLLANKWLGWAG